MFEGTFAHAKIKRASQTEKSIDEDGGSEDESSSGDIFSLQRGLATKHSFQD